MWRIIGKIIPVMPQEQRTYRQAITWLSQSLKILMQKARHLHRAADAVQVKRRISQKRTSFRAIRPICVIRVKPFAFVNLL
jgi:hypothetical protein